MALVRAGKIIAPLNLQNNQFVSKYNKTKFG